MNRNIEKTDRILLRVVAIVLGLFAASIHWWVGLIVLVASELALRVLIAYLDRSKMGAPSRRPSAAGDPNITVDEADEPAEAGSFGSSRLLTDPVHRQLPANIWHDTLD